MSNNEIFDMYFGIIENPRCEVNVSNWGRRFLNKKHFCNYCPQFKKISVPNLKKDCHQTYKCGKKAHT